MPGRGYGDHRPGHRSAADHRGGLQERGRHTSAHARSAAAYHRRADSGEGRRRSGLQLPARDVRLRPVGHHHAGASLPHAGWLAACRPVGDRGDCRGAGEDPVSREACPNPRRGSGLPRHHTGRGLLRTQPKRRREVQLGGPGDHCAHAKGRGAPRLQRASSQSIRLEPYRSREKVLPEVIYRLPPDQLARFIGVFWMCDGTVGQAGVSATLTSERLVRQLQHLVLRFGIQSKVRPHRSTLNGRPFPAWQLRVYSQSDQTFLSEILLWGTKRARLAALCAGRTRGVQAGVGAPSLPPAVRARLDAAARLPGGRADTAGFQQVAERLGASYRFQFSHIANFETGRINRPGFRAFCEVFGLMDEYGWLLDSDIFWDRIVSIEDVGERHVYDLTVEPTACFVANDVIVHNTYVWRQMLFGRTAWVIDPKGEYNQLAAFCGTEPIRFRSGGSLRLNPLDPMIGGDAQLALLRSIAAVMLGRNL